MGSEQPSPSTHIQQQQQQQQQQRQPRILRQVLLKDLDWRALVGLEQPTRDRNVNLPASLQVSGGRFDSIQQQQSVMVGVDKMDAYDISMGFVLAIHSGQRKHNRTSHFMICEDKESYSVDWCTSTNSSVDVRLDW